MTLRLVRVDSGWVYALGRSWVMAGWPWIRNQLWLKSAKCLAAKGLSAKCPFGQVAVGQSVCRPTVRTPFVYEAEGLSSPVMSLDYAYTDQVGVLRLRRLRVRDVSLLLYFLLWMVKRTRKGKFSSAERAACPQFEWCLAAWIENEQKFPYRRIKMISELSNSSNLIDLGVVLVNQGGHFVSKNLH